MVPAACSSQLLQLFLATTVSPKGVFNSSQLDSFRSVSFVPLLSLSANPILLLTTFPSYGGSFRTMSYKPLINMQINTSLCIHWWCSDWAFAVTWGQPQDAHQMPILMRCIPRPVADWSSDTHPDVHVWRAA